MIGGLLFGAARLRAHAICAIIQLVGGKHVVEAKKGATVAVKIRDVLGVEVLALRRC